MVQNLQLADQGNSFKYAACLDAAKAFFESVPDKPDPVIGAAFSDKIFAGNGYISFNPVCLSALETFIDSNAAGDDLLTANL